MTCPPLRRIVAAIVLAAGASTACGAQLTNSTPTAAPSVTLDQVPHPTGSQADGTDRTAETEVAQPDRPSRDTAVLSSEIGTRPADRSIAAAPIGGLDRCDVSQGAERSALCRQRLETKAGRYARPAPAPVTSEGRLLLLVTPNGAPRPSDARQLGAVSGLDAPNGPAQQLAGALRNQASQDGTDAASRTAPDPATPLNGLPPVVVLPSK